MWIRHWKFTQCIQCLIKFENFKFRISARNLNLCNFLGNFFRSFGVQWEDTCVGELHSCFSQHASLSRQAPAFRPRRSHFTGQEPVNPGIHDSFKNISCCLRLLLVEIEASSESIQWKSCLKICTGDLFCHGESVNPFASSLPGFPIFHYPRCPLHFRSSVEAFLRSMTFLGTPPFA